MDGNFILSALDKEKLIPVQYFNFANNDAADTQHSIIIPKDKLTGIAYTLDVYNPSTETDLYFKLFNMTDFESDIRYHDTWIQTVTIPKTATTTGTLIKAHYNYLSYLFINSGLKIVISNKDIIGAAGAFVGAFRLSAVYGITA